jgi:hypothetical protein
MFRSVFSHESQRETPYSRVVSSCMPPKTSSGASPGWRLEQSSVLTFVNEGLEVVVLAICPPSGWVLQLSFVHAVRLL